MVVLEPHEVEVVALSIAGDMAAGKLVYDDINGTDLMMTVVKETGGKIHQDQVEEIVKIIQGKMHERDLLPRVHLLHVRHQPGDTR
jgi:hypothetical protein